MSARSHLPGTVRRGAAGTSSASPSKRTTSRPKTASSSSPSSSSSSSSSAKAVPVWSAVVVKPTSKPPATQVVFVAPPRVELRNPFSGDGVAYTPNLVGGGEGDAAEIADQLVSGAFASATSASLVGWGMTGSGKSHLLLGGKGSSGVAHHVALGIFHLAEDMDLSLAFGAHEIFMDQVTDLLDGTQGLKVVDSAETAAPTVLPLQGSEPQPVSSLAQLDGLLSRAIAARHTGAHKMNKVSSRSHMALTFRITVHRDGRSETFSIFILDLAGGMREEHIGSNPEVAKVAIAVNRSLAAITSVVGDVLSKKAVVRYREHVVTRLFKEILGGKTALHTVFCIHQSDRLHDESLATLKFIDRLTKLPCRPPAAKKAKSSLERAVLLQPVGDEDDAVAVEDEGEAYGDDDDDDDDDDDGHGAAASAAVASVSVASPKRAGGKTRARTLLRLRPMTKSERERGVECARPPAASGDDLVMIQPFSGEAESFPADYYWGLGGEAALAREMVDDAYAGRNSVLLALGLVGSGKTHSLFGDDGMAALIGQALWDDELQMSEDATLTVELSLVELYADEINDLLDSSASVRIMADGTLMGVSSVTLGSAADFAAHLRTGLARRARESAASSSASCSHVIASLLVRQWTPTDDSWTTFATKSATLRLVDTAGAQSNKVGRGGATSAMAAKTINRSLTALTACTVAYSLRKKVIPVRESDLTRTLIDVFGGNTSTNVLGCFHGGAPLYDETVMLLRSIDKMRKITGVPKVNKGKAGGDELQALLDATPLPGDAPPARSTPSKRTSASPAATPSPSVRKTASTASASSTGSVSKTPAKVARWRVALVLRPLLTAERRKGHEASIRVTAPDVLTSTQPFSREETNHEYDLVAASLDQAIRPTAVQLAGQLVGGDDVAVLGYGLSGGGKTRSLFGEPALPGLFSALLKEIFLNLGNVAADDADATYSVGMLFFELYNDGLRELTTGADGNSLKLFEDKKQAGKYNVQGCTPTTIRSFDEGVQLVEEALDALPFAATALNPQASRAHAVLQIHVTLKRSDARKAKHTMCTLADLAGLGRNELTECRGDRQAEEKYINSSLASLSAVTSALERKLSIIPFRDSTLTRLLSPAFHNCRTWVWACASPSDKHFDETSNVLKWASAARKLKNKMM